MSQFTKKAIVETFMNLIKEQSLDKITVKDIVETCGVNRNTFYYYYQDIYDLIDDIFTTETKRVIEDTATYANWYDELREVAKLIVENRVAIKHIYDSKSRDVLDAYLDSICSKLIRSYVDRQAADLNASERDKDFVASFYGHSLVGITLQWVRSSAPPDSEVFLRRVAAVIESSVPSALEALGKI